MIADKLIEGLTDELEYLDLEEGKMLRRIKSLNEDLLIISEKRIEILEKVEWLKKHV